MSSYITMEISPYLYQKDVTEVHLPLLFYKIKIKTGMGSSCVAD